MRFDVGDVAQQSFSAQGVDSMGLTFGMVGLLP